MADRSAPFRQQHKPWILLSLPVVLIATLAPILGFAVALLAIALLPARVPTRVRSDV